MLNGEKGGLDNESHWDKTEQWKFLKNESQAKVFGNSILLSV